MKRLIMLLTVGMLVNVTYGQNLVKMPKEKWNDAISAIAKEAVLKYGEKLYWDESATIDIKTIMANNKGVKKRIFLARFINDFTNEMNSKAIVLVFIDAETDKVFKINYVGSAVIEILSDEKNFDTKVLFPNVHRENYLKYLVENEKITKKEAKSMKKPEVFKDYFGSSVDCTTSPFGTGKVNDWINENVKYPTDLYKARIGGKVSMIYYVTEEGSITDLEIIESTDDKFSYEVMQVAKNFPKDYYIRPSYKNGKYIPYKGKVDVIFRIPE